MNRKTDRQTDRGIPVVDGGVGEEGHVGGELAPEPEDRQKEISTILLILTNKNTQLKNLITS